MSAPYTGNPANATDTIELFDGLDRPTAQSIIVPLQRLLDGVVSHTQTREQRLATRAVQLRTLFRAGDTIDATTDSIAAIQLGKLTLAIKANTNGVFY